MQDVAEATALSINDSCSKRACAVPCLYGQWADASPLSTQWLLRLHRRLLGLEAEVLDINAVVIGKPLQEAVGQNALRFV